MARMRGDRAVDRLSHDVLAQIASHLTGVNAINFGLVCKAWSQPAEGAIWSDLTIELKDHYGETPYVLGEGFIVDPQALEQDSSVEFVMRHIWAPEKFTPQHFARLAGQRRSERMREKYESILAGIYARAERRNLVRRISMDSSGGFLATALLSAVRKSLVALAIRAKTPVERINNQESTIASPMKFWDGISQLSTSSAIFPALTELSVDLVDGVSLTMLGHFSHLTPNLSCLTVNLDDLCDFDQPISLSDVCEPLTSVRTLTLATLIHPYEDRLEEMNQVIDLCPNVTKLSILHPLGTPWSLDYDTDASDEEAAHDDFFFSLSNLQHLTDLVWHIEALQRYSEWQSPSPDGIFPQLESLRFEMPDDEFISLSYDDVEPYIPALPRLQFLSFCGQSSSSDQDISKVRYVPHSALQIPMEAIRRFKAAPRLDAIFITLFTSESQPQYHSECLLISSIRLVNTDGPHLYITHHAYHPPGESRGDLDYRSFEVGTNYMGHPVPTSVIDRMAEIEDVSVFKERDVPVSSQAWAVLDKYMESLAGADDGLSVSLPKSS